MRAPTYTPRERACISMADRIVVRLYVRVGGGSSGQAVTGTWVESEVWPTQHEDLAALLRRVQGDLEHGISMGHHELRRVCVYAVADHPLWGEMRACLPRVGVPVEVLHPLADPHYPVSASAL